MDIRTDYSLNAQETDLLSDILRVSKCKYVDFCNPNFSFIDTLFFSHLNLFKDITNEFSVTDDTDLNCDVCQHYYLKKDNTNWELCVSLVGHYVMLTKELSPNHWVILEDSNKCTDVDLTLMKVIKKHHFTILSKFLLKTVVNGFKTEDENGNFKEWAHLYEILFFINHYCF
ncbi:hypothetical protein FACS18942_07600 [Planctomycetales bacterium]|nr:hypothetical protein FACS18942_07600 [Planctomycetales bacterium]